MYRARSVLLAAALALCTGFFPHVPELVEGLPAEYEPMKSQFNARVQEKFPIGTEVEDIANELENEGFQVNKSRGYAIFRENSRSCLRNWMIRWARKEGVVTSRDAEILYNCH